MERTLNGGYRSGTALSPRKLRPEWTWELQPLLLSNSHLQRLVICLLALTVIPCPAMLFTFGNYISQAPMPLSILMGLANGKHWEEGGEIQGISTSLCFRQRFCLWLVFPVVLAPTGWPFLHGLRSSWTGSAMLSISIRWHLIDTRH